MFIRLNQPFHDTNFRVSTKTSASNFIAHTVQAQMMVQSLVATPIKRQKKHHDKLIELSFQRKIKG
jgi:hypothetical protein